MVSSRLWHHRPKHIYSKDEGGVLAGLFKTEKVYAITGTFYPDPDPETSTVDAYIGVWRDIVTFSALQADDGTNATVYNNTSLHIYLDPAGTQDRFYQLRHAYILFDTSTLTTAATINSAIVSLYSGGKTNNIGSPDLHLSASTPSSNTNLVTSDFPNIGRTSFGSITYANFPASNAYGDITINSTGLVAISKTSITKYGLSFDWDLYNSFTGSWNSTGASSFTINSAESGGVSTDPKLVVTYTLPANPKQDVIWFD